MKYTDGDDVSFGHWVREEPEGVVILGTGFLAIVAFVVFAVMYAIIYIVGLFV